MGIAACTHLVNGSQSQVRHLTSPTLHPWFGFGLDGAILIPKFKAASMLTWQVRVCDSQGPPFAGSLGLVLGCEPNLTLTQAQTWLAWSLWDHVTCAPKP